MSVANTTIVARLARDPETKSTDRGLSICKLTLPVDNRRTDSTTWWTATLFGKAADIAMQHLSKGAWVAVSGAAHVRIYDKKDGSKGFSAELDNCTWDSGHSWESAFETSLASAGGALDGYHVCNNDAMLQSELWEQYADGNGVGSCNPGGSVCKGPEFFYNP